MHELRLPDAIQRLIDSGVWPAGPAAVGKQELCPVIGEEQAHKVSPDDDRIVLMAPPFHTIQDEVEGGNEFWTAGLSNVGEIDYRKALIIADFGVGSDSPIILYFNARAPVVMYLKWTIKDRTPQHSWVQTHTSFNAFAEDVGLTERKTEKNWRLLLL